MNPLIKLVGVVLIGALLSTACGPKPPQNNPPDDQTDTPADPTDTDTDRPGTAI